MTLKVEYLCEYVVIFKTPLANKSRGQVGSIHEKDRRLKIS
jgi:hypothetical protein